MDSITFVRPCETIPISVTGGKCALNCPHCSANYLVGMRTTDDLRIIEKAPSYLITGGCDTSGKVPILENLELFQALPQNSKKIAHSGLMDDNEAETLSEFIDAVSFNFVGDDETINEIYGLERSVDDFADSYKSLSSRLPTYPHLTIGLNKGRVVGEFEALKTLESLGSKTIVLNVFIPTPGTELGHLSPPPLDDVRKVIEEARGRFSKLYIGCMRPGGSYRRELDLLSMQEGCDRIVNPSRRAREFAAENGLEVIWKEECCIL